MKPGKVIKGVLIVATIGWLIAIVVFVAGGEYDLAGKIFVAPFAAIWFVCTRIAELARHLIAQAG